MEAANPRRKKGWGRITIILQSCNKTCPQIISVYNAYFHSEQVLPQNHYFSCFWTFSVFNKNKGTVHHSVCKAFHCSQKIRNPCVYAQLVHKAFLRIGVWKPHIEMHIHSPHLFKYFAWPSWSTKLNWANYYNTYILNYWRDMDLSETTFFVLNFEFWNRGK